MARIPKKTQRQIIEAVRRACHDVAKGSVPNTLEVPPDQWTTDETAKSDLIAECEYKAVAEIEALFAGSGFQGDEHGK